MRGKGTYLIFVHGYVNFHPIYLSIYLWMWPDDPWVHCIRYATFTISSSYLTYLT